MNESTVLSFLRWGFGICVTGFLFLAGWMWWIVGKLHDKVSFDWIENQFQKGLNTKIDNINVTLTEIKNALVGDFNRKGLITKVDDIEKNCIAHKEK